LPDGRQRSVQELVRGPRRGGLLAVRALGRSRTRLPGRRGSGCRGCCGRGVVAIGYFRVREVSECDQFFRGSGSRAPQPGADSGAGTGSGPPRRGKPQPRGSGHRQSGTCGAAGTTQQVRSEHPHARRRRRGAVPAGQSAHADGPGGVVRRGGGGGPRTLGGLRTGRRGRGAFHGLPRRGGHPHRDRDGIRSRPARAQSAARRRRHPRSPFRRTPAPVGGPAGSQAGSAVTGRVRTAPVLTGCVWAASPVTGRVWAASPLTGRAWAASPLTGRAWAASPLTGRVWAGTDETVRRSGGFPTETETATR